MSVINDMLRDLDARKAPERNGLSGEQHSLVEARVQPKWYLPLAILLILLLVLAAFWLGVSSESSSSDHQPLISDAAESQTEVNNTVDQETKTSGDLEDAKLNAHSLVSEPEPPKKSSKSLERSAPAEDVLITKPKANTEISASFKAKVIPVPALATKTEVTQIPRAGLFSGEAAALETPAKALNRDKTSVRAEKHMAEMSSPRMSTESRGVEAKPAITIADQTSSQVRLTPTAQDQQIASQNQKLLDKGQVAFSLKQLYAFIAESEEDSYSRTVLATYLLQTQRFAEAGDVLMPVDVEDIPALRLLKARWLAQAEGVTRALTWLEINPPEVSKHADYFSLLANYYQQAGKFEQSVETYANLLELDAEQADWWLGLGVGYDRLKRYDDAAFAYRQAVALPSLKSSLALFANDRLKQLTR